MNDLEERTYRLTLQYSPAEIVEALHKAYINRAEWHIKRGDHKTTLTFLERAGAMTKALEVLHEIDGRSK